MLSFVDASMASGLSAGVIGGLGMPELIIILVVVLIIFGPKQLPKIGRAIGSGVRELKEAASKMTEDEPDTEAKPRMDQPGATVVSSSPRPAEGAKGSSEEDPSKKDLPTGSQVS